MQGAVFLTGHRARYRGGGVVKFKCDTARVPPLLELWKLCMRRSAQLHTLLML